MRAYLFVDTLRRALEFNGYRVRHVMNITDVGHMTSDEDAGEDKIEKTARAEGKTSARGRRFLSRDVPARLRRLNIELPPGELLCRATDHIPEMQALIRRILERGFAYVAPSGVYFDVEKYRGPEPDRPAFAPEPRRTARGAAPGAFARQEKSARLRAVGAESARRI